MAKTLLQLTNEVGKNLRRSTGSTWSAIDTNQDQIFIQQAINEAKRMVEDAWKWDVLTQTILFPTVASTDTYDTSDLGVVTSDPTVTTERSVILRDQIGRLQMWDLSGNGARMHEVTRERAESLQRFSSTEVAIPSQVAVYQNGSGLTVHFAQTPSAARNYAFQALVPQDDLAAAATVITVPWRPVVLAATALSAEERGEELGLDATRWWEQYESALGSAIGQDGGEADFQLQVDTLQYFHDFSDNSGDVVA